MLHGERLKGKMNSNMASWDKIFFLFFPLLLLYYLYLLVLCIHSASRPKSSTFSYVSSVPLLPPPSSLVWYHKKIGEEKMSLRKRESGMLGRRVMGLATGDFSRLLKEEERLTTQPVSILIRTY